MVGNLGVSHCPTRGTRPLDGFITDFQKLVLKSFNDWHPQVVGTQMHEVTCEDIHTIYSDASLLPICLQITCHEACCEVLHDDAIRCREEGKYILDEVLLVP